MVTDQHRVGIDLAASLAFSPAHGAGVGFDIREQRGGAGRANSSVPAAVIWAYRRIVGDADLGEFDLLDSHRPFDHYSRPAFAIHLTTSHCHSTVCSSSRRAPGFAAAVSAPATELSCTWTRIGTDGL